MYTIVVQQFFSKVPEETAALKMEAADSSEALVNVYQTEKLSIPRK
jgi:hypothetical protein